MLWEKEKLLVMSNFSFSYSVFEDLYCGPVNTGLVWVRVNQFKKHLNLSADSINLSADSINLPADSINLSADSINLSADSINLD